MDSKITKPRMYIATSNSMRARAMDSISKKMLQSPLALSSSAVALLTLLGSHTILS